LNTLPNLSIFTLCLVPWIVFYFFDPILLKFNFPSKIHVNDWHKELEYIGVLKQAITQGSLPFSVPNFQEFFGQISSEGEFLGMPIYTISPLIIFLYFLEPMQFHILNHLVMVAVGFVGCLLIKRDFNLSLIAFFFLVITFNLYGGFTSKISAYGPSQLGYYLSIYIIWILLRITKQNDFQSKQDLGYFAILLSLSLSFMLYQGSLHYYVQWITFLIFWGLFNPKYLKFLFLSAFLTISLCALRLFPAIVINGSVSNMRQVGGYGLNPEFFLQTFISIRGITDFPEFAWWENSNYISIFGFSFILLFGVFYFFSNRANLLSSNIKKFIGPLALIFFISFSDFRLFLIPDFLPLLNIESVTTRYFFIVVLFMLIFSCLNFDKFYKKINSFSLSSVLWLSAFMHFGFLFFNSYTWSLQLIQNKLYEYGGIELKQNLLIQQTNLRMENIEANSIYINSIFLGFLLSCLTILVISFYSFRLFKKKNSISQNIE